MAEEDAQSEGLGSSVGTAAHQSYKVVYHLSKPCTCMLCDSKSDDPTPLVPAPGSEEVDRLQGKRPWAKYRKVLTGSQGTR